jgi:thiol-disulfide isomerase/thioredoxin
MEPATTQEHSGAHWPLILLLVLAGATLVALQWRRPQPPNPLVGLALPTMDVAGWINTDRPLAPDDLRGDVVLIDFWMTTCGPCVRQMPKVIDLHQRFEDQGLKVIGLTPEPDELGQVSRFVQSQPGMDFAIGYGAGFTFERTGVRATPTYLVFDRTGRSVWAGHWLDEAEDAAVAALAKE